MFKEASPLSNSLSHGRREGGKGKSSASPVKDVVGASAVPRAAQNLPAVLNDPRCRRETDFFTKTWGEEFVPPAIIPPSPFVDWIELADFKDYRSKIANSYKAHQRNKKIARELQVTRKGQNETAADDDKGRYENRRRGVADLANTLCKLISLAKLSKDIDLIPEVFLEPGFALENPDTFNSVLPWSQFEHTPESRKETDARARPSAKLLQEKLTHYLDIAEVELARQISLRSEDFFNAMSSQDVIVDRVAYTCAEIRILREKLQMINEISCKSCLAVLKLKCCRARSVTVYNKLKLMATVHQTQPMIQVMLSSSDYVGALDLIGTTQEVLQQELAGVQSFRHLGSQLAEMQKVIEKMMEATFSELTAKELNKPVDRNYDGAIINEEDRILAVLVGLLRQKKLNFLQHLKDEAFNTIKATVKQSVAEFVSDVDNTILEDNNNMDTYPSNLTEHIQQLNFPQWINMLQHIFGNGLVIMHRVKGLHDLIMDITRAASARVKNREQKQDTSTSDVIDSNQEIAKEKKAYPVEEINDIEQIVNDAEYENISKDSKEILCAACELLHVRLAKLLGIRARDDFLERLTSSDFMILIRTIHQFMAETDAICDRKVVALHSTMMAQVRKFISKFHEERKTKMSLILDSEQWKQADVPLEFQALVNELENGGIKSAIQRVSPQSGSQQNDAPAKVLIIKGERYAVVGTLLMLLKTIIEYCECVNDIPILTCDMTNKVEEILKLFNSRTCQLVLGAGALQVVGLRTITSKHLALAYRCLQVMIIYIPQIKLYFQSMLPRQQYVLLSKFEHLKQDYQNHCNEINSKLISIMDTVFLTQLGKWEVKAPTPSQCFRGIIKQVIKLHEALSDLLLQEHIQNLFSEIMGCFASRLRARLVVLEMTDDCGSQHGLVTSELLFFVNSLRGLHGLSNIDEKVKNVWKDMHPRNQ